jgi:hypothetical protein
VCPRKGSDSAYITNTVIDKQRAKTIALFVPEATILSKADQKTYWDDPYMFVPQINLNQADVCVEGTCFSSRWFAVRRCSRRH